MKIEFDTEEERKEFIQWANKEKDNSPEMKKMRKDLDKTRKLRKQMKR